MADFSEDNKQASEAADGGTGDKTPNLFNESWAMYNAANAGSYDPETGEWIPDVGEGTSDEPTSDENNIQNAGVGPTSPDNDAAIAYLAQFSAGANGQGFGQKTVVLGNQTLIDWRTGDTPNLALAARGILLGGIESGGLVPFWLPYDMQLSSNALNEATPPEDPIRKLMTSAWKFVHGISVSGKFSFGYELGEGFKTATGAEWVVPETHQAKLVVSLMNTIGIYKEYRQYIDYKFNEDNYGPGTGTPGSVLENLQKLFESLDTMINKSFFETTYELDLPKFSGVNDLDAYGIKALNVLIRPEYNHYIGPYENNISDIPEFVLPNIYVFVIETLKPTLAGHRDFIDMKNVDKPDSFVPLYPVDDPISLSDLTTYLKNYGVRVKKDPAMLDFLLTRKKYATTGFSVNSLDLLKLADEEKDSFPMYSEIKIMTAKVGKVGQALKKYNMFDTFMKAIMYAVCPKGSEGLVGAGGGTNVQFMNPPLKNKVLFTESLRYEGADFNSSLPEVALKSDIIMAPRQTKLVQFSLDALFKEIGTNSTFTSDYIVDKLYENVLSPLPPGPGAPTTYGLPESRLSVDESVVLFGENKKVSNTPFLDTIKSVILNTKLKEIINEKTRSVYDIFAGCFPKPCVDKKWGLSNSEILFYEIVKFEVKDSGVFEFAQNIFLPNTNESSMLKYIDTQVKYGKKYCYQIYAHTLIMGTKYKPLAWGTTASESEPEIETTYSYEPHVVLIRSPYYNTMETTQGAIGLKSNLEFGHYNYDALRYTMIKDSPPVFPDINIVPFRAINDKILINFNFMGGEYDLSPITFSPEEEANIDEIRKAQNAGGGRNWKWDITYKSDEHVGFFETYRITTKPTSYQSFAPLVSNRRGAPLDSQCVTTLVDTLKPNVDYYYMFRIMDIHGNTSNPTPIYKVRIVDTSGIVPYMVMSTFFIEDVKPKVETRQTLMKYIMIKPTFEQAFLDEDVLKNDYSSAEDINGSNLTMGEVNKKADVFGKKFKVRFTSKKTGRKFDLDIDVKRPKFMQKKDPGLCKK